MTAGRSCICSERPRRLQAGPASSFTVRPPPSPPGRGVGWEVPHAPGQCATTVGQPWRGRHAGPRAPLPVCSRTCSLIAGEGDGSCCSRALGHIFLLSFATQPGRREGERGCVREDPRESDRMRRGAARTPGDEGRPLHPLRHPAPSCAFLRGNKGMAARGGQGGGGGGQSWCMRNASPGEPCTWHPLCKCVFTDDGRQERAATRAREPPRAPSRCHAHTTHGPTP